MILASCSEKWPMYDSQENRLGFEFTRDMYGKVIDSLVRYTFVYEPETTLTDTIWLDVRTLGFLTDYDRQFEIEQTPIEPKDLGTLYEGEELTDAEAGLHYVPFDDPSIKERLVVKAGTNGSIFPLVVKRDDPELRNGKFYIKLKVKENENFKESYPTRRYRIIEISDIISKPQYWNYTAQHYFCGKYGPEKLRFMINNSDWKVDEDFFKDLFEDYDVDMGYTGYLSSYYTEKLVQYNRERQQQGLDVLKESDGTIVRFTLNSEPQPYI